MIKITKEEVRNRNCVMGTNNDIMKDDYADERKKNCQL